MDADKAYTQTYHLMRQRMTHEARASVGLRWWEAGYAEAAMKEAGPVARDAERRRLAAYGKHAKFEVRYPGTMMKIREKEMMSKRGKQARREGLKMWVLLSFSLELTG
jgi:hypothetical protein